MSKGSIRKTKRVDSKVISAVIGYDIYTPTIVREIFESKNLEIEEYKSNQVSVIMNKATDEQIQRIINEEVTINKLYNDVKGSFDENNTKHFLDPFFESYKKVLLKIKDGKPDMIECSYQVKGYINIIKDLYKSGEINDDIVMKFVNITNSVFKESDQNFICFKKYILNNNDDLFFYKKSKLYLY